MIIRLVTIAVFLTLGACASSPRYVAADDPTDYGHYSRQISEDRYRVNFNGNSRTGFQDTRDYTLLRAAELTLAKGHDWFQVVDRETATTESRDTDPQFGFGYQRATYVEQNCGLISCTRSERPYRSSYVGIDNHPRRTETRHSHSLEIVMGTGKMPEGGHYYNAADVVGAMIDIK